MQLERITRWNTERVADDFEHRSRLLERLQILDGILDALARMDEIDIAVRRSQNRQEARKALLAEPFRYSESVATHILDLSVSRQTIAGIEELKRERSEAAARLKELG